MTNGQRTEKFLGLADSKIRESVLANIAKNYGITLDAAMLEITDPDAEHLLDYVTGPERAATSAFMQIHGLA
jgi:hypothetical protein